MNQKFISFITLLPFRVSCTGSFADSIAIWVIILILVLLGASFFVKPLWFMEFVFSWIGFWNKILLGRETLPSYTEKQKQDTLNEDGAKHKITEAMAKFIGIVYWIIVGVILWAKFNQ